MNRSVLKQAKEGLTKYYYNVNHTICSPKSTVMFSLGIFFAKMVTTTWSGFW